MKNINEIEKFLIKIAKIMTIEQLGKVAKMDSPFSPIFSWEGVNRLIDNEAKVEKALYDPEKYPEE